MVTTTFLSLWFILWPLVVSNCRNTLVQTSSILSLFVELSQHRHHIFVFVGNFCSENVLQQECQTDFYHSPGLFNAILLHLEFTPWDFKLCQTGQKRFKTNVKLFCRVVNMSQTSRSSHHHRSTPSNVNILFGKNLSWIRLGVFFFALL